MEPDISASSQSVEFVYSRSRITTESFLIFYKLSIATYIYIYFIVRSDVTTKKSLHSDRFYDLVYIF